MKRSGSSSTPHQFVALFIVHQITDEAWSTWVQCAGGAPTQVATQEKHRKLRFHVQVRIQALQYRSPKPLGLPKGTCYGYTAFVSQSYQLRYVARSTCPASALKRASGNHSALPLLNRTTLPHHNPWEVASLTHGRHAISNATIFCVLILSYFQLAMPMGDWGKTPHMSPSHASVVSLPAPRPT